MIDRPKFVVPYAWDTTEAFEEDYAGCDDPTRAKIGEALNLLKTDRHSPLLDIRAVGPPESYVFSIRVDDTTRLTFKDIGGIIQLRQIGTDETLEC